MELKKIEKYIEGIKQMRNYCEGFDSKNDDQEIYVDDESHSEYA